MQNLSCSRTTYSIGKKKQPGSAMKLIELIAWILVISFIMEFIDSTLGGGYGTILTPVLMLAGFEPLIIVPSILVSEILTGFTVGLLHDRSGNVDVAHDHRAQQSLALLIGSGALGIVFALFLATALPAFIVKLYIAVLVVAMGVVVLVERNHTQAYSPKKIGLLGLLCSFNKGISGGGYGPVSVSGQLLSGVESKPAVAVTSISEAAVCVMGVFGYTILLGLSDYSLLVSLCLGAIIATPFAAITVSKTKMENLRVIIGLAVLVIGIVTLIRLL